MTMSTRLKKVLVTIAFMMFLCTCLLGSIEIVYSDNTELLIDIFTQKEPYSGRGPGTPSDSFGPGEIVSLFALVTDNHIPLHDLLVTFYVRKPNGESFTITKNTDMNGISKINFTIPQTNVNETGVFGEWKAWANAVFGNSFFSDSLQFKVDWIVKILSVRTINANLTYQTSFGIGGDFGLEITLRSIAMCIKKTALAVVVQDELDVPIIHHTLYNLSMPPNEKIVYLYCKFNIPYGPHIGKATIYVSSLTAPVNQSGFSYCPVGSTEFFIGFYDPLTIDFYDVAILDVTPYASMIEPGQVLDIGVLVRNEGTDIESFNVSIYLGGLHAGSLPVTLSPYYEQVLNFTFNTSALEIGSYIVTALIHPLEKEADHTDNNFLDGIVEIKAKEPSIVHDLAITNMKVSKMNILIGEPVQINVTLANEGTETETFTLDIHYDSQFIATRQIENLISNSENTLTFIWNTNQVKEGFYQITAFANPVPGEENLSNNQYVSKVIQVRAEPPIPPSLHDIAILTLTPSSPFVHQGKKLDINLTVENKGTYNESFRIIIYYDSNVAGAISVESLKPGYTIKLVFHWKTDKVSTGNYTLSALAEPVPNEENTTNNYLVDGIVEVRSAPALWVIPFWFWLFLLMLIILLTLLSIWLHRRRKRNKAEESFYSGWTAWYYSYNLKDKV
jgi:hypothetical protein